MAFEHNDIVTVDRMNKAIAEGGGGGGGITWIPVTVVTPALKWTLGKNFNEMKALIDGGSLVGIVVNTENEENPAVINQIVGAYYTGDELAEQYQVGFGWSGGGGRLTFYGTSATGTLTCDLSD